MYKIIQGESIDSEAIGSFKDFKDGLEDNFEDVDSVVLKYDKWAHSYDKEHVDNGWKILLNYLAYSAVEYLDENDRILDVGCGTGLLGRELSSYGFCDLHGIDISRESLKVAETIAYKSLECAELGKALNFSDGFFSALFSAGVFTRNQVPLNAFEELIRILRPGGLFVVVLRVEDNDFYYKKIEEYYSQGIMYEISKEKISVLQSCNHEIIMTKKATEN